MARRSAVRSASPSRSRFSATIRKCVLRISRLMPVGHASRVDAIDEQVFRHHRRRETAGKPPEEIEILGVPVFGIVVETVFVDDLPVVDHRRVHEDGEEHRQYRQAELEHRIGPALGDTAAQARYRCRRRRSRARAAGRTAPPGATGARDKRCRRRPSWRPDRPGPVARPSFRVATRPRFSRETIEMRLSARRYRSRISSELSVEPSSIAMTSRRS